MEIRVPAEKTHDPRQTTGPAAALLRGAVQHLPCLQVWGQHSPLGQGGLLWGAGEQHPFGTTPGVGSRPGAGLGLHQLLPSPGSCRWSTGPLCLMWEHNPGSRGSETILSCLPLLWWRSSAGPCRAVVGLKVKWPPAWGPAGVLPIPGRGNVMDPRALHPNLILRRLAAPELPGPLLWGTALAAAVSFWP